MSIFFSFQLFSLNGTMTIMFMTIDRFIAVCFPFKAKLVCTPKKAKITVTIIFITTIIYSVPQFLFAKAVGKNTCVALAVKSKFSTIVSWAGVALNSIIPFSVILALNSFIIYTFKQRSKYFERNSADRAPSTKESDENKVKFILHKYY